MTNLLIEPDELELRLDDDNVVIADLCKAKQYAQAHIPGAHFVNYIDIVHIEKPVMGLLPEAEQFSKVVSELGITENTHIVAYDDEGGGCAARFLWTLHVFGHDKTSLLNGGLHSWANEGHALSNKIPAAPTPSSYTLNDTGRYTANRKYITEKINQNDVTLLDARSLAEYTGTKKFAEKAGHIPGAIHYEWTEAMNLNNNMRLLPLEDIQKKLDELNITNDKEVICYCQSHHRSAFSYYVLRVLGYENVKGYPGSWSDWGNHPDSPVEI